MTLCKKYKIKFETDNNILSPDDTTLFCSSGMQRHKPKFLGDYRGTFANIQSCLRLNDLDEIDDGNHLLYFNMIGLFSFRELDVHTTVKLFYEFLQSLGVEIDYVTIHPDKLDWKEYHTKDVRLDSECVWTDGNISGYCTEFYSNGLEIGNIVNPLGTCIDVGFGLERLMMVMDSDYNRSETDTLIETVNKLLQCGVTPSPKKHGYVLRKLIYRLIRKKVFLDNIIFQEELVRYNRNIQRFQTLYPKFKSMPDSWWWDTHGIVISDFRD